MNDDANIACEVDVDCPDGFRCVDTGSCRAFDASDDVTPEVSVDLNKLVFARGDTLELSVEADEELAFAPRVIIGIATLESESFDGQRATYSLVAVDDGLEGTRAVEVIAEDLAGNEIRVALALVTFDFTPPSLFEGSVRLELNASPDNPLDDADLRAIAASTEARLTFTAVENLEGIPLIDAGPNSFVLEQAAGNGFAFTLETPRTDGTFPLFATLVDIAGNTATIDLGLEMVVDSTPPEAPLGLILVRRPWGTDGQAPSVVVEVPEGAIPDGHLLSVRQSQVGVEIARAGPEVRAVNLPVGDVVVLDATLFDAAGNPSPRVDIARGRWTATLAGTLVDEGNPHRAFSSAGQVVSTIPLTAEALVDDGWASGRDDLGVEVSGRGEWRESASQLVAAPTTIGIAAHVGTMVFDPQSGGARALFSRHTFVFTDGQGGVGVFDEISGEEWVFSGTWRQIVADNKPEPRAKTCAAYDSSRDVAVVFGGEIDGAPLAATFEVSDREWREVTSPGPSPRVLCAMTYDAARGAVVMSGGLGADDVALDDAWAFDGANWTELPSVGERAFAAVFDERAQTTLMVLGSGVVALTDDGWTRVYDAAFVDARAAYDPVRDEITILPESEPLLTLKHDGSEYVARSSTSPFTGGFANRPEVSLTYDRAARELLLTGTDGFNPARVFARRGDNWIRAQSDAPLDGHFQRNIFLDAASRIVLVGGATSFTQRVDDVWVREGQVWTEVFDSGLPPLARAAVTGTAGGGLLFGGFNSGPLDGTWTFDSANNTWTQQTPLTSPSRRSDAVLVVDAISPLLFGGFRQGSFQSEMFRYIDDDWTPVGTFPDDVEDLSAVFDATRQVIVAVSSTIDPSSGAFVFRHFESDGANNFTARQLTRVPTAPDTLDRPTLVFDSDRDLVIYNDGELLYRLEADGWVPELAVNEPDRTLGGFSIYDPTSRRLVNIKEVVAASAPTWEFRAPSDERPGLIVQFDLDSAGVDLQDIDALRLSLSVDSEHRAFVIDPSNRRPLPSEVFNESGAAVQLAPRPRSTLEILVEPVATNGSGAARAALDYAELEMTYTRAP